MKKKLSRSALVSIVLSCLSLALLFSYTMVALYVVEHSVSVPTFALSTFPFILSLFGMVGSFVSGAIGLVDTIQNRKKGLWLALAGMFMSTSFSCWVALIGVSVAVNGWAR